MDQYQQILHDVANAPTKQRLGEIYAYVAGAFTAVPQFIMDVASACQVRDAQLTAAEHQQLQPAPVVDQPFAPHELGQPLQQLQPPVPAPGSFAPPPAQAQRPAMPDVKPVGSQPPGWMKTAADFGLAQRNAVGAGGLPALDVLRVAFVDLACAAWDCGCDLSEVEGLKAVQTATPEQCWQISEAMLMRIRAHLAQLKKR